MRREGLARGAAAPQRGSVWGRGGASILLDFFKSGSARDVFVCECFFSNSAASVHAASEGPAKGTGFYMFCPGREGAASPREVPQSHPVAGTSGALPEASGTYHNQSNRPSKPNRIY